MNNFFNSAILLTLDEESSLACCDYLTLKTCAVAFALLEIPYLSAQHSKRGEPVKIWQCDMWEENTLSS